MSELSKLAQQTVNFTAAWDERKRTFDRLRKLDLTDEERNAAITDYQVAAKHFDSLKQIVYNHKGG